MEGGAIKACASQWRWQRLDSKRRRVRGTAVTHLAARGNAAQSPGAAATCLALCLARRSQLHMALVDA